jgi:hypothetical protein
VFKQPIRSWLIKNNICTIDNYSIVYFQIVSHTKYRTLCRHEWELNDEKVREKRDSQLTHLSWHMLLGKPWFCCNFNIGHGRGHTSSYGLVFVLKLVNFGGHIILFLPNLLVVHQCFGTSSRSRKLGGHLFGHFIGKLPRRFEMLVIRWKTMLSCSSKTRGLQSVKLKGSNHSWWVVNHENLGKQVILGVSLDFGILLKS